MKPSKINFESSTGCNARCVFCPRYDMTRSRGQMSDELFHKIIKEGKEMGVYDYSPFMNGEPFVFGRIWEWLDYMQKENVRVALYTNGVYVDIDRLSSYNNIKYLNFSINAATSETHNKVMRGPDFKLVRENYDYARKKMSCMVRASFVVTKDNVDEIDDFKKMFKRVEITGFANWTGARDDDLARVGKRVPCWVLLHQMFILWDGTVVPCCMDFDGKQTMGDANVKSLQEIWDYSLWMREKHLKGDFSTWICRGCNYNVDNKLRD